MTTNPPLFTIITVTKNNLAGLQATERSVGQQSCNDYEWIIMDGDSTDGTKEYSPCISHNIFSEPDNGIYDAMNKGLKRASGEYILFLNAGDKLASSDILEYIKLQVREMVTRPPLIYGDALEQRYNNAPVFKPARTIRYLSYGMITHHQAMLYHKDALGNLTYNTDYGIAADYDFTLRFIKSRAHTESAVYIPKAICMFEAGGVSQKQVRQGRNEQFYIRQKLQTVTPVRNYLIYYVQTCAMMFRRICPHLYWLVRRQV